MKKTIVIFGVGHLAKHIVPMLQDEYSFIGLSRSFSCKTDEEVRYHVGNKFSCNKTPEAIIVNFPPSEKLEITLNIIDQYFNNKVPLIFVSSTSVYSKGEVTEGTPLNKNSRLYDCEMLLSKMQRRVTVVRPGGLFDSMRNPGQFFKNKLEVSGANLPVNMVHCHDVAAFIGRILDKKLFGENYNLVASTHPSKAEFYGKAMGLAGRKAPVWVVSESVGKIVINDKSCLTGFNYKYDDLLLSLDLL